MQRRDRAAKSGARAERSTQALAVDHLMDDLGRRTARGGAVAIASQIIKLVIQIATLAILARLLSPADFGLVAMAATVTLFVGLFADLGLAAATVQREKIDQSTISVLFYINLAAGFLAAALTIAAAPLAAWGFGDERVSGVVIALALQIPFVAAAAQHTALLRRGMRWLILNWTAIAAQFAGAAVGIGLAWKTELGYWALVAQSWVAALTGLALAWATCPWRPGRIGNWKEVRAAVTFGILLMGFNFVNYFHRQLDDILIGWRWGAAELGYYNRAYQLLLLPLTVISNPIGTAVVPALSRLQDQPQQWRRAYLDALGAVTLLSSGITAILIAVAEPLVAVLFGPDWNEAADIFRLLAISMFAATPMNAMGWVYISLGSTGRMFKWGLISTPFVVLSFFVGLPFGATGVALAYSCAVCFLMLPCMGYAAHGTPVRIVDMVWVTVPSIALGIVCAAIGYASSGVAASNLLELFVTAGLVLCLYLLGIALLVVFHPFYARLRDGAFWWSETPSRS